MSERLSSDVSAWLAAVAATAAAVLIRWLLDGWLHESLPFVTLFAAVAAAVWVGGYRPALLVVVLGYLACDYLFIEPRGGVGFHAARNVIGLLAYLVSCSIVIGFGEATRVVQRRAKDQHESLRITLASIGDAVITTNADSQIEYLNATAESLTGWTRDEAKGQPLHAVFRIIDEQTREAVANPAARALQQGIVVGLANHTVLIRKDGTERPIDDSAAPIRDARGIIGCVLVFRDITERRHLEQQNAERLASARLLAAIVDSSDDAIISKSMEGTIQSWNAAAKLLFGYSAEEAVGQHISLIVPPEQSDEEDRIMKQLRSGKRVDHFHTVRKRSDAQLVDVSLTISPIFDDAGRVVGASKIARNIGEQKDTEKRIDTLMMALTEADHRKDEFLATLAHELRGPLAPIRNALEIMGRAEGNVRLLEHARSIVDRQLSQMERLIDDLLDISRITRNSVELRKQRVELASVLYQAVEVCRPLAEAAKVEIAVTLPPESIHLDGDPARLSQVFTNLLNNACKFTKPGGRIWLTAKREATEVVVSVKDDGIGIPSGMLVSIFEPFTQVDRTLEQAAGGLGIGLSLVKQLVELHKGMVRAFSDGPGFGSEFVVHLPILAEKPESSQPPASKPAKQPRGCRILVVDDNKDNAESLGMLLRMIGNETQVAYDGQEAVEAAEQFRAEVVLLDIGLPKLNGLDACRRIRGQPWGKNMVLVALTGWGQVEDRRKSQEAGFDGHLVKPVNYTELMNLLASLQERQ